MDDCKFKSNLNFPNLKDQVCCQVVVLMGFSSCHDKYAKLIDTSLEKIGVQYRLNETPYYTYTPGRQAATL